MRSYRIGRVLGIPPKLHLTFLIVLPLFAYGIGVQAGRWVEILNGMFGAGLDGGALIGEPGYAFALGGISYMAFLAVPAGPAALSVVRFVLGFGGLFLAGNLFLVAMAVFIYISAAAEARQTVMRTAFDGITVRDVMTPREEGDTVTPDATTAVTHNAGGTVASAVVHVLEAVA